MTHQHQRRRIFIDRPIQSALLLRAALYWAVSLLAQLLIVSFFVLITSSADDFNANGARLWSHIQLSLVASLAILPMILLDILKLSHRWVGPLFRSRASLHALSRGEPVPPIQFREGDFWQELASDVNVVTAELNRHRAASREADLVTASPFSTSPHDALCESQQETDLAAAPFTVSRDTRMGSDASASVPLATGWSALPTSAP